MEFICKIGTDKFYLRNVVEGDRITVNITDLKCLWQVSLTEKEIVERFKVLNPLVQANPEWIVTHVRSCLDTSKSTFGLTLEDDRLTLNMHTTADIKVRMSFVLVLQDSHHFFKLVTNPMVAVITQLMEQRTRLLELVKSKDLELREYKLEGAEISRKNVETEEIIEKTFVTETAAEFTSRIQKDQCIPELKLSPDLSEVFMEAAKLEGVICKLEPEDSTGTLFGNGETSLAKAEKRPLGNQTIIQVSRAKERKKTFKL